MAVLQEWHLAGGAAADAQSQQQQSSSARIVGSASERSCVTSRAVSGSHVYFTEKIAAEAHACVVCACGSLQSCQ